MSDIQRNTESNDDSIIKVIKLVHFLHPTVITPITNQIRAD